MKHINIIKVSIIITFIFSLGYSATNEEGELITNNNLINSTNDLNTKTNVVSKINKTICIDSSASCKEVTNIIDNFEQSGWWYGKMFNDHGLVQVQRRRGYADNLRELLGADNSTFVLGMKVNFRRTYYSFAEIIPPFDVHLFGNVRKLSIWVLGKNIGHKLFALIQDARGKLYRAPFSSGTYKDLAFEGWNKLEAEIPVDSEFFEKRELFKKRVVQSNPHVNNFYFPEGIIFKKLIVEFDAEFTEGVYYIYLDQLEYVTDIYKYDFLQELRTLPESEITYPLDNW